MESRTNQILNQAKNMTQEEKLDYLLEDIVRIRIALAGDKELKTTGLVTEFANHEGLDESRNSLVLNRIQVLEDGQKETRTTVKVAAAIAGFIAGGIQVLIALLK